MAFVGKAWIMSHLFPARPPTLSCPPPPHSTLALPSLAAAALIKVDPTVNNDLPKFRDLVSNGTKVKFLGCLDVNVYQHMVNLYKLGFVHKKL